MLPLVKGGGSLLAQGAIGAGFPHLGRQSQPASQRQQLRAVGGQGGLVVSHDGELGKITDACQVIHRDVEGPQKIDAAPLVDGQHRLVAQGAHHAGRLVRIGDVDRLAAIGSGSFDYPEPDAAGGHGADDQALLCPGQGAICRVEVAVLLMIVRHHHLGAEGREGMHKGGAVRQAVFELHLEAPLKVGGHGLATAPERQINRAA